jgi:hypothetical protein
VAVSAPVDGKLIHTDKLIRMDKRIYDRVRALFAATLVLSIATLGAAAVSNADAAVWVRGGIVTLIAAVLLTLARRAFRGSRAAYRRMRLMTTIAPVGVLVIVALPHDGFPAWMKAEQAVVGVLLLVTAIMVSRTTVRQAYRRTAPPTEQEALR